MAKLALNLTSLPLISLLLIANFYSSISNSSTI